MTPENELKDLNNFARRVWRVSEHDNYSDEFWYVRITYDHNENAMIEEAVTHFVVIDTSFCIGTSDPDTRLHEHETTFDLWQLRF